MAIMQVNPTRMELTRLKKRLKTATRGHKLLKDKQDELIKRFIELVRKNKELREELESELHLAYQAFLLSSAVMSPESLEEAIMYPTQKMELKLSTKNIMSVETPVFEMEEQSGNIQYPYGFATTSGELDNAIASMQKAFGRIVELAEVEKVCQLLANEIQKTRRRVNALEYIMIPQLQETIKFITMKLDENERGNRVRLMKIKDMAG